MIDLLRIAILWGFRCQYVAGILRENSFKPTEKDGGVELLFHRFNRGATEIFQIEEVFEAIIAGFHAPAEGREFFEEAGHRATVIDE